MKPKLYALFLSILLSAPSAFGSCAVPDVKANAEFFKMDVVFTGKVLSENYRDIDDDHSAWFYRVSVSQVFKGPAQKEITVDTEDDSNRFPLEVGSEYLLFAYRRHGRLEIEDCGNSALLSGAAKSIQEIQSIATAHDAEIEGWLVEETTGVDLSGIHVAIRGGSRIFASITDEEGYFHFRAPAGRYKVDFSNREYYLNAADVFWYNPKGFRLNVGESAALQLVSVRHPKKKTEGAPIG